MTGTLPSQAEAPRLVQEPGNRAARQEGAALGGGDSPAPPHAEAGGLAVSQA